MHREAEIWKTKPKSRPMFAWLPRHQGGSMRRFGFVSGLRWRLAAALVLALIVFESGGSSAESRADRSTLATSSGHECAGESNCVSEVQQTETLAPDERREFTYTCSNAVPFILNWDVSPQRFLSVGLESYTGHSVTLVAKNYGTIDGSFSVVLGCTIGPTTRLDFKTLNSIGPRSFGSGEPPIPPQLPENVTLSKAPVADPCKGVDDCEVQNQIAITLKPWHGTGWAYYCTADHPFYRNWSKEITGKHTSLVAVNENTWAEDDPSKFDASMFNWNIGQSNTVTIKLGCSKVGPAHNCDVALNYDPGCSTTEGPTYHCFQEGRPPYPVCWQYWTETCAAPFLGHTFWACQESEVGLISCYCRKDSTTAAPR